MVNTGKPSTACFQCRARRIKCDGRVPECEKCIKYGVLCPGYPDKNALVFRDDTTRVRERAIKKYDKGVKPETASASRPASAPRSRRAYHRDLSNLGAAPSAKSPKEGSSSSSTDSEHPTMLNLIVRQPVNGGLVQGATAAFMEQFRTDDAEVFWAAFDCTSVLYPTASSSVCFSFALEAISLLTMSLLDKDSTLDIIRPAMKAYGRALRAINRALEIQDQQTIDHTFMAIHLVCIFETISEFESSLGRAEMHLRGMMSMLSLRGPQQFATKTGRRLFLAAVFLWVSTLLLSVWFISTLSTSLTSLKNCGTIAKPKPIPLPLPKSIWPALLEAGVHEPTYRLLPILDRGIELRRFAVDLLHIEEHRSDLAVIQDLLDSAGATEKEFLSWWNSLPPEYKARTDFYTVASQNIHRCHQIFLLDLKMQCYQLMRNMTEFTYDNEIARCVTTARELIDKMCATTPYDFGDDDPRAREGDVVTAAQEIPDMKVTLAFHITFAPPLLISSMVSSISDRQREGIIAARKQQAAALGLSKPVREFPASLLHLPGRFKGSTEATVNAPKTLALPADHTFGEPNFGIL